MEKLNRHAALAPLQAVVNDAKWYGVSSSVMHEPFSQLDTWFDMLSNLVTTRGLSILLVDLPDIGKIYDKGLSSGVIDWKSLPSGWNNGHDSLLSFLLLSETFGSDGTLVNTDPGVVFFTRQILYLFKKVQIDCPPNNVRKAVDEFIKIESSLRSPSGSWDSDHWVPNRFRFAGEECLRHCHPRHEKIWNTVDDVFASIVPMSEVDGLRLRPKHGPGAVADMKTGGDKYLFPFWPSKLDGVFPWAAFVQHREDLHITEDMTSTLDSSEPPARLIAVPKTYKGPRLIASEPIAHQFLQQGLMDWIRDGINNHRVPVLRTSIDFLSQVPSRDAALLASCRGDMATVDLSSASDRLSCWTVERALGGNQSLLRALHAVRTRTIIDGTNNYSDMCLNLKKFAAQGSAVTFPVQTMVYTGLCIAAVLFVENLRPTSRNMLRVAQKVRVFGDDIILPRTAVPVLSAMLDSLQLKVNVSKTHTSGAFRESCGMDAWMGHDVTPCYLSSWHLTPSPHFKNGRKRSKLKAESLVSWIDVRNNAYTKGLWRLARFMESMVPDNVQKLIPTANSDGDGLRYTTFLNGFVAGGRTRFSRELHRTEALVLASRSLPIVEKRESWHDFYQWLIEAPDPQSKWTAGYVTKNTLNLFRVWVPTDY